MPRVKTKCKMLSLDIETSPHEGTFWNLFPKYIPINQLKHPTEVLCWAAKWLTTRGTIFSSQWTDSREKMAHKMWDLLDEADCVIHYNGKSFDMKHLNREFALFGLPPPSHYQQIDLLQTVRQNFKLASNKLDYVCRYFGLGEKIQHAGIELWYGVMDGDPRDQKIMERYCKRDTTLLPKLYKFLLPWIKNHPTVSLYGEEMPTRPSCSNCGSTDVIKKGRQYNKTQSYQRWSCSTCGTPLRSRRADRKTNENVLVRTG